MAGGLLDRWAAEERLRHPARHCPFGLGALLGFDLLSSIRNWHDLVFYRPDEQVHYQHIDSLFGAEAVDWKLAETHWSDLLGTAISIRENKLSSVTLLRRLGDHSRKNRLYRAFRELGRAIRTITLLRYLSEPALREQIAAITNRTEPFHGFADWLMFGGKLISHNDPDHHEKVVKFTSCSPTASSTPILQRLRPHRRRQRPGRRRPSGRPGRPGHHLALHHPHHPPVRQSDPQPQPADQAPANRLDLEPRVLFGASPAP